MLVRLRVTHSFVASEFSRKMMRKQEKLLKKDN